MRYLVSLLALLVLASMTQAQHRRIEPGKCYPAAAKAPTRITGCACDTLGTCICTWPGCQCPACASYRNEPAPVAPATQPVYAPPVYYQLRPTFTPQSYFPPMQMRAGGRSC